MQLFYSAVALSAVTVLYLLWRSYRVWLLQRRHVLRERVAHLLWVMADIEQPPHTRKQPRRFDNLADLN
jgi:hypothetical protein